MDDFFLLYLTNSSSDHTVAWYRPANSQHAMEPLNGTTCTCASGKKEEEDGCQDSDIEDPEKDKMVRFGST